MADKRNIALDQSLGTNGQSSVHQQNQFVDGELTPAAKLLQKEFELQFQETLNLMNEESREILLMRHSEQMTNQQVAELLGLSEAAAGMRYLRALRQLKKHLAENHSISGKLK